MKTTMLSLFLCLFIFMNSHAQHQGNTWAEVQERGEGTILLSHVITPAFVYLDDDGELTGICVDIMNSFVRYLERQYDVSITVEYVGDGSSFMESYQRVRNGSGGIFGLGNITITEARKEEIQFSPPFITNIAVLVTKDNVPNLTNMENIATEFAGMSGYTSRGTLQAQRIENIKQLHWPNLNIEYVESSGEALNMIQQDGVKGFSYQDLALFWDHSRRGYAIKRHPVGDEFSEMFGITMPLDSDWAPLMERFFTLGGGYRSTSEYRRILTEHLGPEVMSMLGLVRN